MAENLPMPDEYPGGKKAWNRLSKKTQRTFIQSLKEERLKREAGLPSLEFLGGMPGGKSFDPMTGTVRNLPGTPSRDYPILAPAGADLMGQFGLDLGTSFSKQPQYVAGDEWKPGSNPDFNYRRDLQYKLLQLNLFDSEAEFRVGEWGPETAAAYARALAAANSSFMTIEEWMEQAIANPAMAIKAKGGSTRKPLTVVVTDPEDLKATARGVASTLFGRNVKLPDEFMQQMINDYQALQRERQIQNYNMEEVGGEMVDIPDQQAYISNRIEQQYPMQTQQDEFADAMGSVMQGLFGGQ